MDVGSWFEVEGHSKLEVVFWLAQTALLVVAYIQLRALKQQAKATFLFELDKMWESSEFAKARSQAEVLRQQTRDRVAAEFSHLDVNGREQKAREIISAEMMRLMREETEKYVFLMKLCGFFETAGMLVARRYAKLSDIDGLYRISILQLYSEMQTHIQLRAEGMPESIRSNYLTNFQKLARDCQSPPGWRARIRRWLQTIGFD